MEKNDTICNESVDELCNRQSEIKLDHDPNPIINLFLTFPSKLHG